MSHYAYTNLSILAADVNIYAASSKNTWPLMGNHENTEVGTFLTDYLDLDIEAVTKRLQAATHWTGHEESASQEKYGWMGDPLGSDVPTEGLDAYHGDFKKRSVDDCGCGGTH